MLDEVHHLPALSDMAPDPLADPAAPDPAAGWSRALLPLLETARLRLLLSGTLRRADGRSLPVLFGAVHGEASWLDEARTPTGPHLDPARPSAP